MMRLSVLSSSSRGNASVITAGATAVLVDAGISAARLRRGLQACELSVSMLDGIFLTHEHMDHVCGLGVLSRKDALPLFCSRYLAQDIRSGIAASASYTYLEPGCRVQLGALTVTPFCTSHDAVDPLGYVFESEGKRLGYVTDTGRITREMLNHLSGVDTLYLESNYDPQMLKNSGRSPSLIDRISGQWGHLSNAQACELVREIAHPGLQHVVLAHLSPECNTPQLATAAMRRNLDDIGLCDCALYCAPMAERLPWIEIS